MQVFSSLTPAGRDGHTPMADMPEKPDHFVPLDDRGISITTAAFRLGVHSGGDGDSLLQVDLRNTAGFVRHPDAFVTNWLLPMRSLCLTQRNNCPRVQESRQLLRYMT